MYLGADAVWGIARRAVLPILILLLAACGSSGDDITPPTVMQLPTLPPTDTPDTPPSTYTPSATVSPTVSPTPIPPTLTLTNRPTDMPAVTLTLAPPTPISPTPVSIIIQSEVGAFVRSGPDTTYPVVGEVNVNAVFTTLAFTINAQGEVWYLIALANGISAWVSQFVATRVDDAPLGQIAMAVTVPPSPTLSPTPTPTPTPTLTATPTLPPGANARIHDASRVNLRTGPSRAHPTLGLLEPGAPLALIGRNTNGTWLEANTLDGRSGWLLGELVNAVTVSVAALTITWTGPDVAPGIILDGPRLDHAREIYARGQQMGNRANSFIVIGDSTSADTRLWLALFYAIPKGIYDLGYYPELQQTIDFYRPSNAFGTGFQTAKPGFDSAAIFDTTWASPKVCYPGETPLSCEYRRRQPAAAIIYTGLVDMVTSDANTYYHRLESIITALLDLNVIPILNTITIDESAANNVGFVDTMRQINAAIRDLSARYQLPLIDFEQAANALPHAGTLVDDGRHLSYHTDGVLNFNGDERVYGKNLRELMTLQLLEALRIHVYGG